MFDIDKTHKDGYTALHRAILCNNPIIVELLLKEYDANPNVVDNENRTTLMYWASIKDRNLSILKLLFKYRFDFARLINEPAKVHARTVFHLLCCVGNTDHNIACLQHLFSICEKIPHCSINILARCDNGMCGLHSAIIQQDVSMIKYLLENVYFPNNNKINKDGITFLNMKMVRGVSLAAFVLGTFVAKKKDGNVRSGLEIFKLFVSYGMKVNSQDEIMCFNLPISWHHEELVAFILNQNVYPIYKFDKILSLMYKANTEHYGSVSTEIVKSLYNYGLKHGVICNKYHHSHIIAQAAQYNLTTFKTTMLMILEKHGIEDLKQYKQCDIIDVVTMIFIAQSPYTKPDVKSFIEALMCDDETKFLKLDADTDTSNQVVLTCINNHKLKNSNDNKILNYRKKRPVCRDGGNGLQSLCGFKCDECKTFICDDCIIVQELSKKINNSGNNKSVLIAAGNQILQYKSKKQSLNKVELHDKMLSHVFLIVCL